VKPVLNVVDQAGDGERPDAAAAVCRHIANAILEQRLLPGTKLGEAALCEIFGVSRPVVRRVLAQLAHEKLVDRQSHRGAFIASPTVDEARQVFEARRVIEDALVRACVERIDAAALATLGAHVEAEAACAADGDRPRWIRMSGEFHALIARAAGNAVLAGVLEHLIAQTSLIIGLYGRRSDNACEDGAHRAIVDAIGRRDAEAAIRLMAEHLEACEAALDIGVEEGRQDLRAIFAGVAGSGPRRRRGARG